VLASVLGGLAVKEKHDFDDRPTSEGADRGEKLAIFADVGIGVAAAGVLTAVVLLASGKRKETPADDAARLQVTPILGRHTGGLGAHVSF